MKLIKKKLILVLIFLIFLLIFLNIQSRTYKKKEHFSNKKWGTEIHFITFWEKDNRNAIKRVQRYINDNNTIRIIKTLKIPQNNIARLLKNVNSGGKHTNHDIEIIVLEVPNEYDKRITHDNPDGENVNKHMYSLKETARDDYKNYLVAHGSFNVDEANEFFEEYFKLLGDFKNFEEIKSELNNSNIFWVHDRVTYNTFGKELDKDIDLVVDSIPATCFILRTINLKNKCFTNIGKVKNYLFDLQDFDSNYYPKEWLQNIKTKKLYLKKDNIQIPDLENHFMLGLYHMYVHKNGEQSDKRINTLKDLSYKLGYNGNIDIVLILNYLSNNEYKIKKCSDEGVGYFVYNKTAGGLNKVVYNYRNRYFYLFHDTEIYFKEKEIYNILQQYDIVPKLIYSNDKSKILEIEDKGITLEKKTDDELNNIDFKPQILKIKTLLKKNNIKHNDITKTNLIVNNNKLYLIDFEWSDYNNYIINCINSCPVSCKDFPEFKNEKTFVEYLNNNKCFTPW